MARSKEETVGAEADQTTLAVEAETTTKVLKDPHSSRIHCYQLEGIMKKMMRRVINNTAVITTHSIRQITQVLHI